MTFRRTRDAAVAVADDERWVVPVALRAEMLPLLAERVRTGLWILLIAGPVFTVGDLLYHGRAIGMMLVLKGCYFTAVLTAFNAVRGRPSWSRCVATVLLAMAAVEGVLAVSDVFVDDRTTTFLLVSLIAVVTASILPWDPRSQLAATGIAWAAIGWNAFLIPNPSGPVDPAVIAALGATATSLYVATAFHRSRLAQYRAEAGLRASETLKSAIIDAALDAVVAVDDQGRVVALNPAAERILRVPSAEACGHNVSTWLLPPGSTADDVRRLARCFATGDGALRGRRLEITAVRGDGVRFPAELAVAAITQQSAALFTLYLRDLTERRLAEEAQASAALVRVGHEMSQLLEPSLVIERLQALVVEILGADRVTTLLREPSGAAFVAAEGPALAVASEAVRPLLARMDAERLLALLEPSADVLPATLRAAAAGARTVLLLALQHGDEALGLVQAAFASRVEPFTGQERRVARGIAQTASLALANARLVGELAHASRVKSEFLSTMTHELRTPINVVLGFAEMARDGDLPHEERDALLARITAVGGDLLALVEGTLDIGTLEAGQSEVDLHPLSLAAFCERMRAVCDGMPRASEVALRWVQPAADVTVRTNAQRLETIVRHLVGNACKFTGRGHVEVRLAHAADTLRLEVEDTGIGIRPEDQAAVFDLFRQVDGSETRRFGGAGLGLYVVRRFAEQLGGMVALRSVPGAGSTFTVTVPAPAVGARVAA